MTCLNPDVLVCSSGTDNKQCTRRLRVGSRVGLGSFSTWSSTGLLCCWGRQDLCLRGFQGPPCPQSLPVQECHDPSRRRDRYLESGLKIRVFRIREPRISRRLFVCRGNYPCCRAPPGGNVSIRPWSRGRRSGAGLFHRDGQLARDPGSWRCWRTGRDPFPTSHPTKGLFVLPV